MQAPPTSASNVNTWIGIGSAVLSTVIGGVVLLLINSAKDTNKKQTDVLLETKDSVTAIKTELPHLSTDIKNTSEGVKSTWQGIQNLRTEQSNMVTKDELNAKHSALQQNIDKSQHQTDELKNELNQKFDKIQDELWQMNAVPASGPEPTPRRRH